MKHPVTILRRFVQAACLVLIIYGAMLFRHAPAESVLPKIKPPPGMPSTTRFPPESILWATDDPPVIEAYPPGAVCRFNPRGGLFKACFLHMISENLTWRMTPAYLMGAFLFFVLCAFVLGRAWCGWVCPLGTIGDVFSAVRHRLKFNYVRFSAAFNRLLGGTSQFLLWGTLGLSWLIGLKRFEPVRCKLFLPYCQLCPGRLICPLFGLQSPSWRDFSSAMTGAFTVMAWAMLALFLAAFVVGRRIWCRICPIGRITAWFSRGSLLELRKDAVRCNRCGVCAEACPMANTHVRDDKKEHMNHPDCILCLRCLDLCPKDRCLSATLAGIPLVRSRLRETASPPSRP